ncbi:murein L,D-transpeptidase family protein [Tychonema sp. BBK16]|uniref:L,D-transpeptidase family protein n=1 Tax=Tychonema sp. BBK16 TaxID=2699888 RepID=UPI00210444B3|nr:L,D-transpeptidase [Tychonema sp. BBK16]
MELKKRRVNIWIISSFASLLFLAACSIFYWKLVRLGYAVPIPDILDVFCLNNCADDLNVLHKQFPSDNSLNYDKPLTQILGEPDKLDKSRISILVEKSKYRLTVYSDKKPIKSYPVVFGGNPTGDKLKEGDSRTPEGVFRIKDMYPHESWSKFLWLDYPTKQSWRKHLKAKQNGTISWGDSVGSEVGIHGVPTNSENIIKNKSNWTLGCVSLENKDVDELFRFVERGTEVEIIK